METIKGLTIRQPWATLIALGEKKLESRSRRTHHRGIIAIHAGKQIDKNAYERFAEVLKIYGIHSMDDLPVGVVVATAEIKRCHEIVEDYEEYALSDQEVVIDGREYQYGFYEKGRFGWELDKVRTLPEPIPAIGQLGLWSWQIPKEIQAFISKGYS
ncbi:ASCH domain-containing protein [Lysinibacillus sphaericus]|uniref:ASCH domain-containing protein n=1 Tax=Lysinibacillus sphaericus TaxID=1421 RepID=UPI0019D660EA|nr:ASCH domain-containing protein [Lysinibacillus sphaericus]